MSNFQDVPDELVVKILSYLQVKDLIICGQVSKRIRTISCDNSLWVTAILEKKIVRTELLEMILGKGCMALKISDCAILGRLSPNIKSQLRILSLSEYSNSTLTWPFKDNTDIFEELLFSCCFLQHLTIEDLLITRKMRDNICNNGKTLETLNLSGFDITDDLVKLLLIRCNKIKALSLQKVWLNDVSLTNIRNYLSNSLEELTLNANKYISTTAFLELKFMPKLKTLNLYNKIEDGKEIQTLRKHLPHLTIKTPQIRILTYRVYEVKQL